uniref:Uncharacterized protein n=1 Tax=Arundo donax TaxID=35708 RepID=A0A0A9GI95_ARUDO
MTLGCRSRLSIEISLQKSSIFSVVKSCSRNTFIATSVPFQVPRKTSPKNPIPTRVPTVISENSMCHSSYGNKGLFRNGEDCNTLFQVDIRSSAIKSAGPPRSEPWIPDLWGDEGNDTAF